MNTDITKTIKYLRNKSNYKRLTESDFFLLHWKKMAES